MPYVSEELRSAGEGFTHCEILILLILYDNPLQMLIIKLYLEINLLCLQDIQHYHNLLEAPVKFSFG